MFKFIDIFLKLSFGFFKWSGVLILIILTPSFITFPLIGYKLYHYNSDNIVGAFLGGFIFSVISFSILDIIRHMNVEKLEKNPEIKKEEKPENTTILEEHNKLKSIR